ncbi:MAG: long-chain fatty acid transporter [Flavipsychrobacter sp.]|nr:long-chain fatty acid transporter [Flavipsychrobacter sp.]
MKKHVLAASLLLSAATSFGAGYQLNLQGLRQVAMGGTGTAWPWDASTIFYNPGGLARLKGIQAYASVMNIMPATAYGNQEHSGNTGSSELSKTRTFTPFNVYIGGPVQQDSRFALGLGVYSAAGLGLSWNDDWIGKYMVQSIDLQTISFQPTLSYRVGDFLSIGAGFVYTAGTFDLRKALPVHGPLGPFQGNTWDEGVAHLHGNANGVGFNAGIQMKFSEHFQVGATYRSQVNMDIGSGSAEFGVPLSLRSSFQNTTFESALPIPQVATLGIGVRPGERLTLTVDVSYIGWNSYDSLRIDFAKTSKTVQNIREPRKYKNTVTPRIGANYKVSKVVSLMAGGAYDPTPVTDGFVSPELPDADRINLSCGIAIKPLPGFTILAALEGTSSVKRQSTYDYGNFNGVYQTQAVTMGIGLYYNF